MKTDAIAIFLCVIFLHCPAPFAQEIERDVDAKTWTGNVNLFLGAKILDKADWEPLDKQVEGGVLLDVKHRRLPISFALDFLYATDDDDIDVIGLGLGHYGMKVEGRIMELDVGVRKIWELRQELRPYLGGGVAVINGRLKAEALNQSVSDDDTDWGLWLNAGMYVTFADRFNLGIDGRWSGADVKLYDVDTKVGGWHIGLLAGVHW